MSEENSAQSRWRGMSVKDTLVTAFLESTVTSGLIALAVICTMCYCVIQQIAIPDIITYTVGAVVSFFFVTKARNAGTSRS